MLGEPGDVEAQFIRLLNLLDNATDVVLYRSAAISPILRELTPSASAPAA